MRPQVAPLLITALLAAGTASAQSPVRTFPLPGGLRVLLREVQGSALFRARLSLALRPGDLPPGKAGLAALTLRMIDRGEAGHLAPAAFDRALDDGGIRLTHTCSADAITWDLVCRNRDQDRALGLLADRILRPVLDPSTLEAARKACGEDQRAAGALSASQLRFALGLDGSPRATEQSLGSLTFKDLEAFLQRVFRPDRAVLALEGDLGLEQAKALTMLSFGTWTGAPLPPTPTTPALPATPPPGPGPTPAPAPAAPGTPVRIPIPGAPLRILAVAPAPEALSPALLELTALLLRADPTLAPTPLAAHPEPGSPLQFTLAATGIGTERALALLRNRVEALRQRGYTEADLAQAQAAWAARRQIQTLHPQALLARDIQAAESRLAQASEVNAITLKALNQALAAWLDPARLRWAILGDPALLDGPARP